MAKEQHRMVFVDYFATWCEPCRTMDATVFRDAVVQQRLSAFVLLRVDVDRNTIARAHPVSALPSYVVYDPGERERFRITGTKPSDLFSAAIEQIRLTAPSFVRASEMFDAKQDVEAAFLVGNTYSHLQLTSDARDAYKQARKLSEQKGKPESAQMADVLSAFTFAREGKPARAIKLLQDLANHPVSRDTQAYAWLALGNAYRLSKDSKSALEAYERAKSIAGADSTAYKEATAAIGEIAAGPAAEQPARPPALHEDSDFF
jgi:tetratricopeptide (TPR) repeat protein